MDLPKSDSKIFIVTYTIPRRSSTGYFIEAIVKVFTNLKEAREYFKSAKRKVVEDYINENRSQNVFNLRNASELNQNLTEADLDSMIDKINSVWANVFGGGVKRHINNLKSINFQWKETTLGVQSRTGVAPIQPALSLRVPQPILPTPPVRSTRVTFVGSPEIEIPAQPPSPLTFATGTTVGEIPPTPATVGRLVKAAEGIELTPTPSSPLSLSTPERLAKAIEDIELTPTPATGQFPKSVYQISEPSQGSIPAPPPGSPPQTIQTPLPPPEGSPPASSPVTAPSPSSTWLNISVAIDRANIWVLRNPSKSIQNSENLLEDLEKTYGLPSGLKDGDIIDIVEHRGTGRYLVNMIGDEVRLHHFKGEYGYFVPSSGFKNVLDSGRNYYKLPDVEGIQIPVGFYVKPSDKTNWDKVTRNTYLVLYSSDVKMDETWQVFNPELGTNQAYVFDNSAIAL